MFLRGNVLKFLIVSLCYFLSTLSTFGNIEKIDIHVLPESVVYNSQYQLGDIAELDGFDIETIQKIAKIKIGSSPLPGRSIVISKNLIKSKLRGKFKGVEFEIHLPKKPLISRASIKVSRDQISSIVLSEVKKAYKDFKDVNIKISTRLKDLFIPKGKTSYTIAQIGKNGKIGGYSTWKLSFVVNDEQAKQLLVRVKIDVTEEVVVAKDKIEKGRFIQKQDLIKVRKNISKKRWGYKAPDNLAVGQTARRDILQNEEIKKHLVEHPKVLTKGTPVKLVFKSESMFFTNLAIAMQSGRKGDLIPVRTLKSKKTIYAVVVDGKHVEVAL